MRLFKIVLVGLMFSFLFSCENKEGDNQIEVTLLQLNDVYEIAPLSGGKEAGMARVETVHKELLAQNPNTFMFMAGDFLNPSLIGTLKYEGEKIRGKQMIEVMNAMNFDLVTFGNHEFDLKGKDLQKRLNESTFRWTIANAKYKIDSITGPFYSEKNGLKTFIPETYTIQAKDADGTNLKIGFFSVCLPVNNPDYVEFTDVFEAAKAAYEKLEKETDIVIGLTHLAIEEDKKLSEMLPNVPLIMGGHEHYNMLVPVGNSVITKADANARTVYIHKLHYNKKTKKATIKSTLKAINDSIKSDPKVDKIVTKWQVVLNDKVSEVVSSPNEVIYVTKEPLDGRETTIRSEQTNLGKMIASSMQVATKADCAFFNGGSVRIDDQIHGDVTAVDLFRALPYGGAVFVIDVKGDFLKKILNFGKDSKGKGAYLQRAKADWDENKKQWLINGKPLVTSKKYSVAITDFLLTGYDVPFLTHENKNVLKIHEPAPEDLTFDIRKSLIVYMKGLK
ncbi:MAG TPA: bifunctional metallophosphatase/5'-nucleotidase [Lutibacter sp.]|nr:bifunctional metallophosphatase/5'-nucleotidase [Lutibacter sp.]